MTSDRAYINRGIWNDADHRNLSLEAQHLYYMLLTHPTLSYVGVVDWRPKRLLPFAKGLTIPRIEAAAAELSDGLYIVIDTDTEEVLIRSWVKHDGVLKQPRLAVSMANAYTRTASNSIRGVIVHELEKQRTEHPEYVCWEDSRVADVLAQPSVSPKDLPPFAPTFGGPVGGEFGDGFTPNVAPGVRPGLLSAPSPTPTPPTSIEEGGAGGRAKRAQQLPDDWTPTDAHRTLAVERHVDCDLEADKLRDWAASKGESRKDWDATFRNWLRNAKPDPRTAPVIDRQAQILLADRQQRIAREGTPQWQISQ